jgi:hypothetical protein
MVFDNCKETVLPQSFFFFFFSFNNTMTQHSPMSITQLVHSSENVITTNDIQDPDVKIAAEVLGDMARLSNIKKGK